jgi:hypothetical protein
LKQLTDVKGKDMRKVIAVVETILLFATAFSGCLGEEKLVTRQASEFILTASDILGTWTVVSSIDYPTMIGNVSNGASRVYQNTFLNETRIGIIVLVFVSIESAKLGFSNESWRMNYSLPPGAKYSSPGIGDEAQMITMNFTGGFDDKTMLFRKANVVVAGRVMYPGGSPVTDQWFIDLMKTQASKI